MGSTSRSFFFGRRFFGQRRRNNLPNLASRNVVVAAVLFVAGLDFVAPRSLVSVGSRSDTLEDGDEEEEEEVWSTHWTETSREPLVKRPALLPHDDDGEGRRRPHRSKIVVVGGGTAGLHTALSLAEQGRSTNSITRRFAATAAVATDRRSCHGDGGAEPPPFCEVTLLESSRIGHSASGMSKGLVVSGIQVPRKDLAGLAAGGDDVARRVYDLTDAAASTLRERIERYDIQCDLEVGGGLVEASIHPLPEKEETRDSSNTDSGGASEDEDDDDDCEILSASEVRSRLGGSAEGLYRWGEHDRSCVGLNPLALTRGLARACESRGVRIYEKTAATGIEVVRRRKDDIGDGDGPGGGGGRYRISTSTGAVIECDHVVLCPGAESVSPSLCRRLSRSVVPIYTWMAVTEPLGDDCPLRNEEEDTGSNRGGRNVAPMAGDDFVTLNYWRRTPDGRLLFGSLADAYPFPKWLAEYRLRQALKMVYPDLFRCRPNGVKFEKVWGGTLAFPRNAVPLIGRDVDFDFPGDDDEPHRGGVWYATGFGGHGIVPTCMAGLVIAGGILGTADDGETWRLFQAEFPPRHCFWPVGRMGAEAILFVYNIFDWFHVKGVPVPRLPKPW